MGEPSVTWAGPARPPGAGRSAYWALSSQSTVAVPCFGPVIVVDADDLGAVDRRVQVDRLDAAMVRLARRFTEVVLGCG